MQDGAFVLAQGAKMPQEKAQGSRKEAVQPDKRNPESLTDMWVVVRWVPGTGLTWVVWVASSRLEGSIEATFIRRDVNKRDYAGPHGFPCEDPQQRMLHDCSLARQRL